MNILLAITAAVEAVTGVALMVVPSMVVKLLLGAEIVGAGIVVSRVTGIALIALGFSCWPGSTALCGMLTYSSLATLYLIYLGIRGEWVGTLLWPAVAAHAVLTILLAWAMVQQARDSGCRNKA